MTEDMTTALLCVVPTPVGPCTLIGDREVVLACGLTDDVDRLMSLIHPSLRPASLTIVARLGRASDAIDRYFSGEICATDEVAVRQRATSLRERGWDELRRIEPGDPISYGELAKRLDMPRGARAAGQVCARNAVSLFVPCHRVVASNGTLNHYGWGLSAKQWLLDFEAEYRACEAS